MSYLDSAKSKIGAKCPEQSAKTFPDLGSITRTRPSKVAANIFVDLQANFKIPDPGFVVILATWVDKSQTVKVPSKVPIVVLKLEIIVSSSSRLKADDFSTIRIKNFFCPIY
jgi:hypothetical protein